MSKASKAYLKQVTADLDIYTRSQRDNVSKRIDSIRATEWDTYSDVDRASWQFLEFRITAKNIVEAGLSEHAALRGIDLPQTNSTIKSFENDINMNAETQFIEIEASPLSDRSPAARRPRYISPTRQILSPRVSGGLSISPGGLGYSDRTVRQDSPPPRLPTRAEIPAVVETKVDTKYPNFVGRKWTTAENDYVLACVREHRQRMNGDGPIPWESIRMGMQSLYDRFTGTQIKDRYRNLTAGIRERRDPSIRR